MRPLFYPGTFVSLSLRCYRPRAGCPCHTIQPRPEIAIMPRRLPFHRSRAQSRSLFSSGSPPRPASTPRGVETVKANYTKYEYQIAMRDGIRLFTSVYVPKDTSQRYPIMLSRTPYSVQPYGVDAYKSDLGPQRPLRQRRLHRRLPGRPRPLDVGRRVCQHAAATDAKDQPHRDRREHRHV